MRNLQIIGNVPQVRRESNFGEYAEEATIIEEQPKVKKENPHFLEANTLEVTMQHLKEDCITPVFAKDNELTIPHPAFIDTVYDAANTFFSGESIDKPDIRVSHIIKGSTFREAIITNLAKVFTESYRLQSRTATESPHIDGSDIIRYIHILQASTIREHIFIHHFQVLAQSQVLQFCY